MNENAGTTFPETSMKDRRKRPTLGEAVSQSPLLWGGIVTYAFYAAIPVIPYGRDQLQRYFCSHPLEYALVGLFFIGLAILFRRFLQLTRERAALAAGVLPDVHWVGDADANATALDERLKKAPRHLQETALLRRLRDTCDYLKRSHSASGLEAHLKHLSETAADRLQESYSLLLTINWSVPILGFLGTVIGITLAIANVTPEQLDTSLNSVTGGLAVAFDTTTVAMSFSLILVFAYDWIKRSEQQLLSTVDDLVLREVLPIFSSAAGNAELLQQAQADAAKTLMDRTETLVREQTDFWRDSVDGLRERWSQTLADQQRRLSEDLSAQVATTLEDHSSQLHSVRRDFLAAIERSTEHFRAVLEEDRRSREQRDAFSQQQFEQIWQRVSDDLQVVIRTHDAHTEDIIDGLMERLVHWQSGLEHNAESIASQTESLQLLTNLLLRLADQEQHLIRVQGQLSENLESVRAAETFEQTLHNLTAAVHLLTARAKPKAA